jgi:bifunctional polynucleotide phosphatase/kinase
MNIKTYETVKYIYYSNKIQNSTIYAFDLDSTLINSIRENVINVKSNVIKKLVELSKVYPLVIFSNQASAPKDLEQRMQILSDQFKTLNINHISMYMATKKDNYRKPNNGMWLLYLKHLLADDHQIPSSVIFVGDASGEIGTHSSDDSDFAKNIGATYYTPDDFFGKQTITIPDDIMILLLVGYPASGKSTLAKKLHTEYNFEIVSRDELGTMAKCLKKTKDLIIQNKRVIIDNLNTDINSRAPFIELGKQFNKKVGAIDMNVSMLEAMERNELRDKHVPKIVYYKFRKSYQQPSTTEGFDWI